MYVYYNIYIHMKTRSSAAIQKWKQQLPAHWPALKGSLAKVYKPCIRKNCPACQRGDKHPAWLLSFSQKGRRRCVYVPLHLVSVIRRALKNGRRLEQLLYRVGPELIKEDRRQTENDRTARPKN